MTRRVRFSPSFSIVQGLLAALVLSACAGRGSPRPAGEQLVANSEAVWSQYECATQRRPFLKIERYEILPKKVSAGRELNQRIVYALCPARPSQIVTGDLYRRIRHKGQVVFEDTSKNFELKPGKWSVDAFITVPPKAVTGTYSLEASFKSRGVEFLKSQEFFVTK